MIALLRTLLLLCCAVPAVLPAVTLTPLLPELPPGARLSLLVQPTDSTAPLLAYQADQLGTPASTQKIVTALAALLWLGPNFHFTTRLESRGTVKNGVLQGDLIVRFSGDPALTRQQLAGLLDQLRQRGVKRIAGSVVIDTSVFAGHDKAPGWPWNDMTQCFSTAPVAAIIDHNCFNATLAPLSARSTTLQLRLPAGVPVTVTSQASRITAAAQAAWCDLDVTTAPHNRYTLTGCVPASQGTLPLSFAVQDAFAYVSDVLRRELKQRAIQWNGRVQLRTTPTPPAALLAETRSPALPQLLRKMLKASDNLIADTLFRTLGHRYFNQPGSWRNSAAALREILAKRAGIDLQNSVIVDGSGLSRHNLIAPTTLMSALRYIAHHDAELHLIAMLPVAGQDGTLRYRAGLQHAGLTGQVFAKTGSLQGVYNLAGFMQTASGQQLAFVQFISAYSVHTQSKAARRQPLINFESRLYQQLYQSR